MPSCAGLKPVDLAQLAISGGRGSGDSIANGIEKEQRQIPG